MLEVTIFLILSGITFAGIIMAISSHWSSPLGPIGVIAAGAAGLFAGLWLFIVVLASFDQQLQIAKFEQTRGSYQAMREDGRTLEGVSIYKDIAEANRWLAASKREREIGFTIVNPKRIEDMEPIR